MKSFDKKRLVEEKAAGLDTFLHSEDDLLKSSVWPKGMLTFFIFTFLQEISSNSSKLGRMIDFFRVFFFVCIRFDQIFGLKMIKDTSLLSVLGFQKPE